MPEKNGNGESIRARSVMLAMRKDVSPWSDTKALYDAIMELGPKKAAAILHDKETDENGNLKAADYHVMMYFDNARSLNSVAKKLGVPPQNLEVWDQGVNNGFSYLLHRTSKARAEGKHEYDLSEVIANFDFKALMDTIEFEIGQAKIARGTSPKAIMDAVYAGAMTPKEAEDLLTGSQYAIYGKKIEQLWSKRLQRLADEWRENMIDTGRQVKVIWIYGRTGMGKSSLALEIAEKHGAYFKSGSSRDTFQSYKGEHVIILDELRERTILYDDLLKILDPFSVYSGGSMAPSRYQDKALAADLFIITTPYNPYDFYMAVVRSHSVQKMDKFDQLARRLTLVLEMDNDNIYPVQLVEDFDPFKDKKPQRIPGVSRPNPYSQAKRPESKPDPEEVFSRLFGADATAEEDNTPV